MSRNELVTTELSSADFEALCRERWLSLLRLGVSLTGDVGLRGRRTVCEAAALRSYELVGVRAVPGSVRCHSDPVIVTAGSAPKTVDVLC